MSDNQLAVLYYEAAYLVWDVWKLQIYVRSWKDRIERCNNKPRVSTDWRKTFLSSPRLSAFQRFCALVLKNVKQVLQRILE